MNLDEKIVEVVSDVLVRFREHDQYRDRAKALRAHIRRCPSLKPDESEAIFDYYDRLLAETILAADRFRNDAYRSFDMKAWTRMSPEQQIRITTESAWSAITEQLRTRFPKFSKATLETFVNWVIFWHILK